MPKTCLPSKLASTTSTRQLLVGQHVHVQDSRTKLWDKVGQVLEVTILTKDHSYKVKVDSGGICWRIRKFIHPVPEPPDSTSKPVTPDVSSPSPASSKGRGEKRVRFNPPPDSPHHSSRPTRRPAFSGSLTAPPSHQAQGGDDASAIVQRVGLLRDIQWGGQGKRRRRRQLINSPEYSIQRKGLSCPETTTSSHQYKSSENLCLSVQSSFCFCSIKNSHSSLKVLNPLLRHPNKKVALLALSYFFPLWRNFAATIWLYWTHLFSLNFYDHFYAFTWIVRIRIQDGARNRSHCRARNELDNHLTFVRTWRSGGPSLWGRLLGRRLNLCRFK